jgi:hypothetical protein
MAGSAGLTLTTIAVAFVVPWVTFYVEPDDSTPWWTIWVPIGTWILIAAVGISQMVRARGGRRWLGAVTVLGDVVAFYAILAVVATATGGG